MKGLDLEMNYFERLKEIHQLQWDFLIDYWYVNIVTILLGILIVIIWILKK